MSLLYFNTNDFSLRRHKNAEKLCTKVKGLSLIFYHSNKCEFCHVFVPIFKELPKRVGGCMFGTINISENKELVEISKKSTTPLEYVPYIVLYIDGVPFMRYDGQRSLEGIRSFIFQVAERLQQPTAVNYGDANNRLLPGESGMESKLNNMSGVEQDTSGKVGQYTLGQPKTKEVCYLTLDNAY